MYSGNDSTEAQNYTQWALNPAAYQNMSNDQVDWAALAQQWIIMKEAGPPVPEQVTNVPPPNVSKPKKETPAEGGEAPMEVENDSEDVHPQWNDGGGSGDSWSWNQQQWGWGNTWSPSGVPPPNSVKTPLLPTPPAFNQYSSNDNCNDNSNYGYTSVPSTDYQGGYWTAAGSSKVIKPHNKRYSKVNVPTPVATPKPVTLDAAKRKQLPAWIREGLEKMERDKLKQIDKERERQEKEEYEAKLKLSEKNALEILKSTVKEQQKSKFESDGEDSDDGTDGKPLTPEPMILSQEELMLKVRHTMTEILLKVTNREISNICKEELQRHIKRMKASDQRVSAPSGANLSAKLGLGAYEGSGTSSDSSDDESSKDHHDSDAELKDIIRRRKVEFSKIEREIEDKLAEADRNEGDDSRAPSPDCSDNDSQVDARTQGGKSFERTPPIKNAQNLKHRSRKTSSSSVDSDSDVDRNNRSKDRRTRRDRRSSSSESSRSDKYKRCRSRTPDQKRSKYSSLINSDRKSKHSESKSSSSLSRRSRSKSVSSKRRRSRSTSVKRSSRRDAASSRSRYSKRSHSRSRSRSRSYRRSSYDRSRSTRSTSRSRRSTSRSYTNRRRRSPSRHRSRSRSSTRQRKHRRSRSYSSGRGKRSHRH